MPATLNVLYPKAGGTTFDFDYYVGTHGPMVGEHFGPHGLQSATLAKGLNAGAPDAPAAYHVIATLVFESMDHLQAALAAGAPVVADIANFYSGEPQMMIGEAL